MINNKKQNNKKFHIIPIISIIVITRNSELHIKNCIKSVYFAKEIILIDNGSIDKTSILAIKYKVKVLYYNNWLGFGPQKNRALCLSNGHWVLSLDVDERITNELSNEIQSKIYKLDLNNSYEFPRLSWFHKRIILEIGWWPDHIIRLFKRKNGFFTNSIVHEKVVSNHILKQMNFYFEHDAYRNLDIVLDKINRYSSDYSYSMYFRKKNTNIFSIFFHTIWSFFKMYFIKKGFLIGVLGIILSIIFSFGTFLKYAKLILLNKCKLN